MKGELQMCRSLAMVLAPDAIMRALSLNEDKRVATVCLHIACERVEVADPIAV